MKRLRSICADMGERQREILILAGLLGFGVLFRVLVMRTHFTVGWDEPHYLQMAASLAEGRFAQWLHPFWSPMYPVCVALLSLVIPGTELAARVASMIAGVAVLLPIYGFARRMFGKACGYLSVGLLAASPSLAYASTSALSGSTYIFFSVAGVTLGWLSLQRRSLPHSLGAGVLFAFAYLTRPEGIGFLGVYMVILTVWALADGIRKKHFRRLLTAFFTLICFLMIAGPYFLYLHQETGRWTFSAKGFVVQQLDVEGYVDSRVNYSLLSEDDTIYPKDAIYHEGNFMKLVGDGRHETRPVSVAVLLKKYATNYYRVLKYGIPEVFGAGLFLLFVLGLFGSFWEKRHLGASLYILSYVGFFWFVVVPMFHVNTRYLLSGFVLGHVWMGKGLYDLYLWARGCLENIVKGTSARISAKAARAAAVAVAGILLVGMYWLPEFGKVVSKHPEATGYWDDAVELKRAGFWLREHGGDHPILMTQNKSVDFYAGIENVREGVSFSQDNFDRILAYARHKGVDYMVLTERYATRYPHLAFLFDDTRVPESLGVVYEENDRSGVRVRIFQVLREDNG